MMLKKQKTNIEEKVTKCKRNLHMPLTQAEFNERSIDLAKALSMKVSLEHKMASVRSSIKSEMDVQDGIVAKLRQIVAENAEWRDVECEKHLDYENRKVYFVNIEAGGRFDERTMRFDEMQVELPLDTEATPPDDEPYTDDESQDAETPEDDGDCPI